MIIRKGYKYALRTTPYQREALRCFLDGCNAAYNKGLDLQIDTYDYYKEYVASCGKEEAIKNKVYGKISKYDLLKKLPEWRKANDEEGLLLRKTPAMALQQTLLDLDRAYTNFFKGLARFPARRRECNYGSFRILQMNVSEEGIKLERQKQMGWLGIPKLGNLSFYLSRPWVGKPKNVTISLQGDRWFISIQTEYEDGVVESIAPANPKVVGIDIGLEPFLTLSTTGQEYYAPMPYQNSLKTITARQKHLNDSFKGSKNYNKKLLRFEKLHIKIGSRRKDWLHNTTTQLATTYDVIYMPEIYVTKWDKKKPKITNQDKKTQGREEPNVEDKKTQDNTKPKNLNEIEPKNFDKEQPNVINEQQPEIISNEIRRKIRDIGIDEFERQLTYKMAERYKELIVVPQLEMKFNREKSCVEKARSLLPK